MSKKPKKKKKTAKPPAARTLEVAAIVCQAIVHFGAGFGSRSGQIFQSPDDAAKFSNRLMRATNKNLATLDWSTAARDAVCHVAFVHGQRAKAAARGKPLTWKVIERTLIKLKKKCPPKKKGGGLVCVE